MPLLQAMLLIFCHETRYGQSVPDVQPKANQFGIMTENWSLKFGFSKSLQLKKNGGQLAAIF